jgi:hypothetical protein
LEWFVCAIVEPQWLLVPLGQQLSVASDKEELGQQWSEVEEELGQQLSAAEEQAGLGFCWRGVLAGGAANWGLATNTRVFDLLLSFVRPFSKRAENTL